MTKARDLSVVPNQSLAFKNRIINGDMRIDQRNAGASVTPTSGTYTLDRWYAENNGVASKYSVQQNAGSVTPPAGFTNYLGTTSLSAYSVLSSDNFSIQQRLEGYSVADLNFGTANAKTTTLSFLVRSSLTGTFGGSLILTGTTNRSYPFSYSIASANTWTQISVIIPGDTFANTIPSTNGLAGLICFSLGVGSTASGTANTWQTGIFVQPTGSTSVVGTNGATFYITGVQLEVGSTATSFDYRPYGTELALCQRYYEQGNGSFGSRSGDNLYYGCMNYKVTKRATPTWSGTSQTINFNTIEYFACYQSGSASGNSNFSWTSSAEL